MMKRYLRPYNIFAVFMLIYMNLACFCSYGLCKDIYVDSNAVDDSASGLSWEEAKKTIYSAYILSQSDDVIHLKNNVPFSLNSNIIVRKKLEWINERGDGDYQNCAITLKNYSLILEGVTNTFKGITFRDGTVTGNIIIRSEATGKFSSCGFINNQNNNSGGAILLSGGESNYATADFKDCLFYSNVAALYGGAIAGERCKLSLDSCNFHNNSVLTKGGGAVIVGMYYPSPPSEAIIKDCIFKDNHGMTTGAVYFLSGEYTVENCLFEKNKALNEESVGGAILCTEDGGDTNISIVDSDFIDNESKGDGGAVRITNWRENKVLFNVDGCLFSNNIAENGGGIHCGRESGGYVRNCIFEYNRAYEKNAGALYNSGTWKSGGWMVVEYCLFYENYANMYGGGMHIAKYPRTEVLNCTFYNNHAGEGGEQISGQFNPDKENRAVLQNSIFWGNSEKTQIFGLYDRTYKIISNCCFPEGKLSDVNAVSFNNINDYPGFIDVGNYNFRLNQNSPCVDKGDAVGILEDLDGSPVPVGPNVDIGAFEFLDNTGKPDYLPGHDVGYYLWQDADDGEWHLRWSGDSDNETHYTGTITSGEGYIDVKEYRFESDDEVIIDNTVIDFNCYASDSEDGLDFNSIQGDYVEFNLYINEDENPVLVSIGQNEATLNQNPFTLKTLYERDGLEFPDLIDTYCLSNKIDATAKLCFYILTCARGEINNPVKYNYSACVEKALDRFESTWAKVDARANLDCSTTEDTAIEVIILYELEKLVEAISLGFTHLNERKSKYIANAMLRAVGLECYYLLKANSSNIKKPDANKFTNDQIKAHDIFLRIWKRAKVVANTKSVVYTGPTDVEVENKLDNLVGTILSVIL